MSEPMRQRPSSRRRPARTVVPTMLACALLAACASTPTTPDPRVAAPLQLAPAVDLQRYMGRWYIVANVPYFAERGKVGSYVDYRLRDDGRIDDIYYGYDKTFDGPLRQFTLVDRVVPGTANARWIARLFWPIEFDYPILYVDAQYRYALVGYPDKSLGWIFAREKDIDNETYQSLLKRFEQQGYDITRFMRVPQRADQIGKPGFQ